MSVNLNDDIIYISPGYDISYYFKILDLLPFLFDKVISYYVGLGETRYVKKCYNIQRIKDLCENNILLFYGNPAHVLNVTPSGTYYTERKLPDEAELEKWIHDNEKFIPEWELSYESLYHLNNLINDDRMDKDFIKTMGNLMPDFDYWSHINTINTDLIDSIYLNSPMLISPDLQPIWSYKFNKLISPTTDLKPHLDLSTKTAALDYFLKSINLNMPGYLKTEDLIDFRRDRNAIKFRNWINDTIQIARLRNVDDPIDLGQEMRMDFQELCKSYEDRSQLIAATFTGMVSAAASYMCGPIGSLISVPVSLMSLRSIKFFYESYGDNKWIFFLLKKAKRNTK